MLRREQEPQQAQRSSSGVTARSGARAVERADADASARLAKLSRLASGYRATRVATEAAAVVPAAAICLGGIMAIVSAFPGSDVGPVAALASLAGLLLPAAYATLSRIGLRRAAALRTLASGLGPASIGPLLQIVHVDLHRGRSRWAPLRQSAIGLLTDALPQMDDEQVDSLDARQAGVLRELVGRCSMAYLLPSLGWVARRRARTWTPEFDAAVVACAARTGDPRLAVALERLSRLAGDDPGRQTVRDAAKAALPVLRDRARRLSEARSLLRPAEGDASADALLRPASGVGAPDPNELLRPAVRPEGRE